MRVSGSYCNIKTQKRKFSRPYYSITRKEFSTRDNFYTGLRTLIDRGTIWSEIFGLFNPYYSRRNEACQNFLYSSSVIDGTCKYTDKILGIY